MINEYKPRLLSQLPIDKIDHYKSEILTKLLSTLKNLICKLHRVAHCKNIKIKYNFCCYSTKLSSLAGKQKSVMYLNALLD